MHFIHRLMFAQAQPSHQQHDIQAVRKARQRQRIGGRAAIRSLMSRALRIWAAIARVDQSDHPVQSDHRAPGQRHRLLERPMAYWAFMFGRSIPASRHTCIRSASLVSTDRSEEHTSELQSRQYLVCRLLLEKKKTNMLYTEGTTYRIVQRDLAH